MTNPTSEITCRPSTCGPLFAKMPIRLEPISPPATMSAITSRLKTTSSLWRQVVEALVDEADLELAVAGLLEQVVPLVRRLAEDRPRAERISFRARSAHPLRRVPVDHQVARVRLRDLEDVEVRVELDADRAERRDRLVEQDEARRQLQVLGVDQREALADQLHRVDLGEPRAVVLVVQLANLAGRAPPRGPGRSGRRGRRAASGSASTFSSRRVDEERGQLGHVVVGELPGLARSRRGRSAPARARGCSPGAGRRGRSRGGRSSSSTPRPSGTRGRRRSSSVYASESRSASCAPSSQLEREHALRASSSSTRAGCGRAGGPRSSGGRSGRCAPRAGSRAPAGSSGRTRPRARAR